MRLPLARAISILGHPIIVLPIAVAFVSAFSPLSLGLVLGVASLLSVYVARKRRDGTFSDADISVQNERPRFLKVSILVVLASGVVAFLQTRGSPTLENQALRCYAAALLILVGAYLLWKHVKPSLHVAFDIYAAALLLAGRFVIAAVVLACFIPVVAWSRWELRRHTIADLWVGAALGFAAAAILLVH